MQHTLSELQSSIAELLRADLGIYLNLPNGVQSDSALSLLASLATFVASIPKPETLAAIAQSLPPPTPLTVAPPFQPVSASLTLGSLTVACSKDNGAPVLRPSSLRPCSVVAPTSKRPRTELLPSESCPVRPDTRGRAPSSSLTRLLDSTVLASPPSQHTPAHAVGGPSHSGNLCRSQSHSYSHSQSVVPSAPATRSVVCQEGPMSISSRWPVRCLLEEACEDGVGATSGPMQAAEGDNPSACTLQRLVPKHLQKQEPQIAAAALSAQVDRPAQDGCDVLFDNPLYDGLAQRPGSPTLEDARLLLSVVDDGAPDSHAPAPTGGAGATVPEPGTPGVPTSAAAVAGCTATAGATPVTSVPQHSVVRLVPRAVLAEAVDPISAAGDARAANVRPSVQAADPSQAPPAGLIAVGDGVGTSPEEKDTDLEAPAASAASVLPSAAALPGGGGAAAPPNAAADAAPVPADEPVGAATASAVSDGTAAAAPQAPVVAVEADKAGAATTTAAAPAATDGGAEGAVSSSEAADATSLHHELQDASSLGGTEEPGVQSAPADITEALGFDSVAANLPAPVIVAVPLSPAAATATNAASVNGSGCTAASAAGPALSPMRGLFDPDKYMRRRDCIRLLNHSPETWVSRSQFEKLSGSNTAKWYRSIRVLGPASECELPAVEDGPVNPTTIEAAPTASQPRPQPRPQLQPQHQQAHDPQPSQEAPGVPDSPRSLDGTPARPLETLGQWLTRHSLPIWKGPTRMPIVPRGLDVRRAKVVQQLGGGCQGTGSRAAPRAGLGAAAAAAAAALIAADEAARAPAGSTICASAAASAVAAAAAAAAAVRAAVVAESGADCKPMADGLPALTVLTGYDKGVSALQAAMRAAGLAPELPPAAVSDVSASCGGAAVQDAGTEAACRLPDSSSRGWAAEAQQPATNAAVEVATPVPVHGAPPVIAVRCGAGSTDPVSPRKDGTVKPAAAPAASDLSSSSSTSHHVGGELVDGSGGGGGGGGGDRAAAVCGEGTSSGGSAAAQALAAAAAAAAPPPPPPVEASTPLPATRPQKRPFSPSAALLATLKAVGVDVAEVGAVVTSATAAATPKQPDPPAKRICRAPDTQMATEEGGSATGGADGVMANGAPMAATVDLETSASPAVPVVPHRGGFWHMNRATVPCVQRKLVRVPVYDMYGSGLVSWDSTPLVLGQPVLVRRVPSAPSVPVPGSAPPGAREMPPSPSSPPHSRAPATPYGGLSVGETRRAVPTDPGHLRRSAAGVEAGGQLLVTLRRSGRVRSPPAHKFPDMTATVAQPQPQALPLKRKPSDARWSPGASPAPPFQAEPSAAAALEQASGRSAGQQQQQKQPHQDSPVSMKRRRTSVRSPSPLRLGGGEAPVDGIARHLPEANPQQAAANPSLVEASEAEPVGVAAAEAATARVEPGASEEVDMEEDVTMDASAAHGSYVMPVAPRVPYSAAAVIEPSPSHGPGQPAGLCGAVLRGETVRRYYLPYQPHEQWHIRHGGPPRPTHVAGPPAVATAAAGQPPLVATGVPVNPQPGRPVHPWSLDAPAPRDGGRFTFGHGRHVLVRVRAPVVSYSEPY